MADFGRMNFSLDDFLDALSAFPEETCATSVSDDSDATDDGNTSDTNACLPRNRGDGRAQLCVISDPKPRHRNTSVTSSSGSATSSTSSESEISQTVPDVRQLMLSGEDSPSPFGNTPEVGGESKDVIAACSPAFCYPDSSEYADSEQSSSNSKQPYVYEPKPLLRKVKRRVVPDEQKTNDYWERRRRNNLAARRSREERRHNEIEVYRTLNFLQQENANLKMYANDLAKHNVDLEARLRHVRQHLSQVGLLPFS